MSENLLIATAIVEEMEARIDEVHAWQPSVIADAIADRLGRRPSSGGVRNAILMLRAQGVVEKAPGVVAGVRLAVRKAADGVES